MELSERIATLSETKAAEVAALVKPKKSVKPRKPERIFTIEEFIVGEYEEINLLDIVTDLSFRNGCTVTETLNNSFVRVTHSWRDEVEAIVKLRIPENEEEFQKRLSEYNEALETYENEKKEYDDCIAKNESDILLQKKLAEKAKKDKEKERKKNDILSQMEKLKKQLSKIENE